MKILITSDFYYEYELYETDDADGLKELVKRMINGEDITPDPAKYKFLGFHDDITTEEAIAAADEIIFTSDF